jgi:hydrogenase nickel incorporation protein HypB
LVSSPGSGKTTFLEKTLTLLRPWYRVAALVGDLATENDARRLARSDSPVKQITTGTLCHLDASMIQKAMDGWDVGKLDFLFVENVGNLVCPSSYDLGEDLRLAVITKMDLAAAVDFDEQTLDRSIQAVRPGMQVLKLSAKTGQGMHGFLDYLHELQQPCPQAASAVK